ncbi:hypothetical protein NWF32_22475 [Pseudomonas qingdaonensis]|nr:hypothetical protein [Pseudomonas qingdaonensis]
MAVEQRGDAAALQVFEVGGTCLDLTALYATDIAADQVQAVGAVPQQLAPSSTRVTTRATSASAPAPSNNCSTNRVSVAVS